MNCLNISHDCIIVTETWLDSSVFSAELFPSTYIVLRSDRRFQLVNRSKGGGVVLAISDKYVRQAVDASVITDAIPLIDIVVCKCSISGVSFYLVGVYLVPDLPLSDVVLFLELLESLLFGFPVIFIGDFNFPGFSDCDTVQTNCSKLDVFVNFCQFMNFRQHNNIANGNGRLLDLVLSNDERVTASVSRECFPLVPEDDHHPALNVVLEISAALNGVRFPTTQSDRYNFRLANYHDLYESFFYIDWAFLDSIPDVDTALKMFYDRIYETLDQHVPKTANRACGYPRWFTAEIRQYLKTKEYYRRRWIRTGRSYYRCEYVRLRAVCKSKISQSHRLFTMRAEDNIRSDPSRFWGYVSSCRDESRIPAVMFASGNACEDPSEIVNGFAREFSSVFSRDADYDIVDTFSLAQPIVMRCVSVGDVEHCLGRLSSKFTSGDDLIPSFLVRDCRSIFAQPLQKIINLSLSTAKFPTLWKRARVTPVFKKGDKSNIANYRPIAIVSNFCKVYEQLLYAHIYPALKPVISLAQHGFMKGRSTVTNLGVITEFLSDAVDEGGQVDVVYTDFSKAFDTIPHDALLRKMSAFGFSPALMKLFTSYLSDRKNYVFYNGFFSNEYRVKSGVPQGTNLGPLLFTLFINDLLESMTSGVLAYADDLKLYRRISGAIDVGALQNDLDVLSDWCRTNGLGLNLSKCHFITYTRKHKPFPSTYVLDDTTIEKRDSVIDLGVTFSGDLSFLPHIRSTAQAALRTLGFVLRVSRHFEHPHTIKKLFQAFVLTKLEYASVIWSPYYRTHCEILERVQRRFLKCLSFRLDGAYPDRGIPNELLLERHGAESLEERRSKLSVEFVLKLLNNNIDCAELLSYISLLVPARPSRSTASFYIRRSRTNILYNSPIHSALRRINLQNIDVFN